MIGFTTIRTGERAALWDRQGRVRIIDGPKRLFLTGQKVQPLLRFTAEPNEYLIVKFKDGRRQHLPGPTALWLDPVAHEEVTVEQAININANGVIVVYVQEGGQVRRKIVRGPALHVPADNEWSHEFRWHGADPKDPRRKVPRALQFTKLRTIPDQMYFDVEDVRTADDALLVVKLMIFFELKDLERMLDQTHDLVADFINALSADVIEFVSKQTFEAFKDQAEKLNDLATYRQLVQRGERVGYQVTKVVYRGYFASQKLQAMHDNAIETRTELQLEAETEEQAQELADLKLKREAERAKERQQMEEAEVQHKNRMAALMHEEGMREKQTERKQELAWQQQRNEMDLQQKQATNQEEEEFLKALRGLEVDLTKYLVAQNQAAEKLIRIDTVRQPNLHIHEGAEAVR
ncbi:MAG: hypothetical protein Q8R91_10725 [Candidatus Omnitrophota bacterium]|nr:hypothetical protein [Candidatus Omnitrophota bacterium]